jgi:hypothetical protein
VALWAQCLVRISSPSLVFYVRDGVSKFGYLSGNLSVDKGSTYCILTCASGSSALAIPGDPPISEVAPAE